MFTERTQKIAQLEELLDKDVYVLCHNAMQDAYIDGTMIGVLRRMMPFSKRRDGAALIIQTPGGYVDEAYYIGEFFGEYYDSTETYVISDCYSGGTVIALSTDKIYLSHSGCLGPIDIQRYRSPEDNNEWYPALSGQVDALKKAKDEKSKDFKFLAGIFDKDKSTLATYYREHFTYKELIGDYIKKHCLDSKKEKKVWEYMTSLNISHGNPLTYKRCQKLGLDVELMDSDIERIIRTIIRDIEKEFGELKSKSVLYELFENDEYKIEKDEESSMLPMNVDKFGRVFMPRPEYFFDKASEKLAVIETSNIGFVETSETGVIYEDDLPISLMGVAYGWEEEPNVSLVTSEQRKKMEEITAHLLTITCMENKAIISNMTEKEINEFVTNAYKKLYNSWVDMLKAECPEMEDMTKGEIYKCVVEYLTEDPTAIHFNEKVEEYLRIFGKSADVNYDELGGAEKIRLYNEFFEIATQIMLEVNKISEAEFFALPDYDQADLVAHFVFSDDFSIQAVEEETDKGECENETVEDETEIGEDE